LNDSPLEPRIQLSVAWLGQEVVQNSATCIHRNGLVSEGLSGNRLHKGERQSVPDDAVRLGKHCASCNSVVTLLHADCRRAFRDVAVGAELDVVEFAEGLSAPVYLVVVVIAIRELIIGLCCILDGAGSILVCSQI